LKITIQVTWIVKLWIVTKGISSFTQQIITTNTHAILSSIIVRLYTLSLKQYETLLHTEKDTEQGATRVGILFDRVMDETLAT
jgi:hypothetical protein